MGEVKRKLHAEVDEESAVVIVAKIREILGIPEDRSVVDFVEKNVVCQKDIVAGVVRVNDGMMCMGYPLDTEEKRNAVKIALFNLNSMATDHIKRFEFLEDKNKHDKRIIIPE